VKPALDPSDFPDYFRALNGFDPFPWQKRLAEACCEHGTLPRIVSLPTGTGKTALIDIGIFHLAYDVASGRTRTAPVRIAWVVDRRLIVDDAYDRARKIAIKLRTAEDGILRTVADTLRKLAGSDAPPLSVQRLRGGLPREADWARTPVQPTVITSTVDQVGSRLLFRGYGVTQSMRPIHAGLLGDDALIVLDEVHLAEPFRQTLERVAALAEPSATPLRLVQLSATPRAKTPAPDPFTLDDNDRDDPTLRARLRANKPARLVTVSRAQLGSDAHADAFVTETRRLISETEREGPKRILVVVNRVELARRVYERLQTHTTRSALLIGRSRDVDKDRIRKQIVESCGSNAPSLQGTDPYIVVATQTVEAGADLDFDILVTQIAPLDALQQRFGRLNRLGRPIEARATIIGTDSEIRASAKPDPIYGDAPRLTWQWLQQRATTHPDEIVDFGLTALEVAPEERSALIGDPIDAPILMPEHLKTLSGTSPAPIASPDPGLYLHGSPNSPADVHLVWRADFNPTQTGENTAGNVLQRVFAFAPPRRGEVLALPASTVRRWLAGEKRTTVADVDGDADAQSPASLEPTPVAAWRWQDDIVSRVQPPQVRPGDTIIVSTRAGGVDGFGWNPGSTHAVDMGLEAAEASASRSFALRIHPELLKEKIRRDGQELQSDEPDVEQRAKSAWDRVRTIIQGEVDGRINATVATALRDRLVEANVLPTSWTEMLRKFERFTVEFPYDDPNAEGGPIQGIVFFAKHGVSLAEVAEPTTEEFIDPSTECDEVGSFTSDRGGETLTTHSKAVRHNATIYAERLQLPPSTRDDVALAAFLHDIGKSDPRFQHYLVGSRWIGTDVLAKSGTRRSKAEDRAVRRAAGLPDEWRHEAFSVRISRHHPQFADAHDPELVLWLVGTHHGYGRGAFAHHDDRAGKRLKVLGFEPFDATPIELPAEPGPESPAFTFAVMTQDGTQIVDWHGIYDRLRTRYGIWGLARLEAILRLADHRASESSEKRRLGASA
jgi:CRISPR-associated endonuclease/helicase Cas3